jgi:hypothetical protein
MKLDKESANELSQIQQMLKETIEKPNFDSSMYEILFHTIAELRRILRAR